MPEVPAAPEAPKKAPEASQAEKPAKKPAEVIVAEYIGKELGLSDEEMQAKPIRVSKGNRGETRITVSNKLIEKLGGEAKFNNELTTALSSYVPKFKASGKPLAEGTMSHDTVFTVEGISPADLALETLGFGSRNSVNRAR
jgi:hypothetical protein